MNYDYAIDMWSLGCLLCELYLGRPLFEGRSEEEQLALICEVFGVMKFEGSYEKAKPSSERNEDS